MAVRAWKEMNNETPERAVSIFAIVVLYRRLARESSSIRSLLVSREMAAASGVSVHVRIADNSPGLLSEEQQIDGVEYRAYPDNPGLARPYNEALQDALRGGYQWLLTLDQDTDLPADFVSIMATTALRYSGDPTIAAIVPTIEDGGRRISPFVYRGGFLPMVPRSPLTGLGPRHLSAINSGALLRCGAIQSLGGYDLQFPLHNSDTRLFQMIDKAGKRVAVADVHVSHELGILNRSGRMSVERYRRMLEDECAFWDQHMSVAGRAERLVRLAIRWLVGRIRGEQAAYQDVTAGEFLRRLLSFKAHRLRNHRS